MKNPQKTKEQLLIELTQIRQSHGEWVDGDLRRRKEFAKAFGWRKTKRQFDYGDAELCEPTWAEIFVELGKLLSTRNFMDFQGNISNLECRLDELDQRIRKEVHPNL